MKYIVFFLLLLVAVSADAQMKVVEGSFKNLKDIRQFNVVFDYEGMQIHGYDSEEAFLKEKMEKREHKEGEADRFRGEWFSDRENKYEPKFIEYFNNRFPDGDLMVAKDTAIPYTMYIKTTWLYPGYNVVAGKESAKISATITVSETANPQKILLIVNFNRSIGLEPGTFDFDQGYRIAGAYEKLAKNMAIQLKRFL